MSCFRTDFRKAPKGLLTTCCCPRARAVLSLLLLTAAVTTGPAAPAHAEAAYGARAVAVAASKQGSPYAYGATGPKRFDCSGLTLYAFKKAGKRFHAQPSSSTSTPATSPRPIARPGTSSSSPAARP